MAKITVEYEMSDDGKEFADATVLFDEMVKIEVKDFKFYLSEFNDTKATYEIMGAIGDRETLAGRYKEACRVILSIFEKKLKMERGLIKRVKGIKIETK